MIKYDLETESYYMTRVGTPPQGFGVSGNLIISPERVGELLKNVGTDPRILAGMIIRAEIRIQELLALIPQEKGEKMTRQDALNEAAKALERATEMDPGSLSASGFLDIADHWIRLATVMGV